MTSKVAAAILGVALTAGLARGEVIEQILVKVNGEVFTKTDLENRQVARLREQGQRIDLAALTANEELRKLLDQITPDVVVDAVDEMLVVQRGRELGYSLGDEQFKTALDSIRTQNKLESEEDFQAALKQEGLTVDDLRRNLERQMLWQRVQQVEVVNRVAITEEESRAYYEANQEQFTTPATVTLREILVAQPTDARGVNVAADDAARDRIDAIRERVVAGGESFDKLAGELSEAPSRANGGLIGPINLDDLSAELRKMIEGMKPGEVTPPLRTPRGYQLLKLEASTPRQTTTFEQARDRIAEAVLAVKRDREFLRYLERLRAQAIIEWKNPEIEKAYQEGLKRQQEAVASTAAS